MPRVFMEIDGFKPQFPLVAAPSQFVHVFQRKLKGANDPLGKNPLYSAGPKTKEELQCSRPSI